VWLCPLVVVLAACGRLAFEPGDLPSDGPSCPNTSCRSSDCCYSLPVEGGTFFRGFDGAADGMYASMANPATVASFHLDRFEVTVGRFREFVAAGSATQASPPAVGAGAHAQITDSGWHASWNGGLATDTATLVAALASSCSGMPMMPTDFVTWTDVPGGNEDRPIDCVSWFEAFAYCSWDGGYLPTAAELMFAAAGGDEQRAYPWSSPPGDMTIDSEHASFDCLGDGQTGCAVTDLVPVGSNPAGDGRWGQSDLAGNVAEWVLDWDRGDNIYLNPCDNCATLTDPGTGSRTVLEGPFDGSPTEQRSAMMVFQSLPRDRWRNVGFRCARP